MKKAIFPVVMFCVLVFLWSLSFSQQKVNTHIYTTHSVVEDSSGSTTWHLGGQADVDTSEEINIGSYRDFSTTMCFGQHLYTAHANSLVVSGYAQVSNDGAKWVTVDSIATGPLALATVVAASADTCYYRKWGLGKTFNGTSGTVIEGISGIVAYKLRFLIKTYTATSTGGIYMTMTLDRQQ